MIQTLYLNTTEVFQVLLAEQLWQCRIISLRLVFSIYKYTSI